MPVSDEFIDYVVDQLAAWADVSVRKMFGGAIQTEKISSKQGHPRSIRFPKKQKPQLCPIMKFLPIFWRIVINWPSGQSVPLPSQRKKSRFSSHLA